MTPLRTGISLAITVGLVYSLCALIWALAPGPSISLMNDMFHGMDFSSMVQAKSFAFTGFLTSLFVLSAGALLAGGFFSWLLNRLTRSAQLVPKMG